MYNRQMYVKGEEIRKKLERRDGNKYGKQMKKGKVQIESNKITINIIGTDAKERKIKSAK